MQSTHFKISSLFCLSDVSWKFTTLFCLIEISFDIFCIQNKKKWGNWHGDQRMKSVIWKAVCMLERFRTASLFISLESTLNPIQPGQPYFWDFIQTKIWKEPSCNPHQDLLAQHHSVVRCRMIVFSSKLASSFKPHQIALNAYSASFFLS